MSRAECDAFNHMHFARLQSAHGKRGVTPKVYKNHLHSESEIKLMPVLHTFCTGFMLHLLTFVNKLVFAGPSSIPDVGHSLSWCHAGKHSQGLHASKVVLTCMLTCLCDFGT